MKALAFVGLTALACLAGCGDICDDWEDWDNDDCPNGNRCPGYDDVPPERYDPPYSPPPGYYDAGVSPSPPPGYQDAAAAPPYRPAAPPPNRAAVAWQGGDHALYVVDASTTGAFPSWFGLATCTVPPTAALREEGALHYAYGHVLELPASFAPRISDSASVVVVAGDPMLGEQAHNDQALGEQEFDFAVGVDPQHLVFYAQEEIPVSAPLANRFNAQRAIPAGLHLLAVEPATPQREREREACLDLAQQRALSLFNARHCTAYQSPDELSSALDRHAFASCGAATESELRAEFEQLLREREQDLSCPPALAMQVVGSWNAQLLSIETGSVSAPALW